MHERLAALLGRLYGHSEGDLEGARSALAEHRALVDGVDAALSEMGVADFVLRATGDQVFVTDRDGNIQASLGTADDAPSLQEALPSDLARRLINDLSRLAPGSSSRFEYTLDEAGEATYPPPESAVSASRPSTKHAPTERHLEARLIRAADGDRFVVVIRDMSQIVEATTARLHRINQEARAEALLELAYAASHDLRAPLRHIKSLAEWLDDDLDGVLGDEAQQTLSLLRTSVTKMDEMLSALLDYARAGQTEAEVETLELNTCILDIVDMLPTEAFDVTVDVGLPTLSTARSPFERVVLNLVANAVKHHDGESGSIAIRVLPPVDGFCEIQVADDGPGIPENRHVDAFKMFKKLEARTSNEGAGMGLALVKKIVEHAGGRIWVSANEPRGAIVHFTWPLTWLRPRAADVGDATQLHRVLVVDDSSLARELTRRMLLRRGFEVVEASNVTSAFAALREQSVEAVITDLTMPGVDGFSLIERIRRDPKLASLPVFVLTAEPSPSYANHAERIGATGYLVKPVKASSLAKTIKLAIEDSKARTADTS